MIVHFPGSEQVKEELAKRVAEVHAEIVFNRIAKLKCPIDQKIALLDAIQKKGKEDMERDRGDIAKKRSPLC